MSLGNDKTPVRHQLESSPRAASDLQLILFQSGERFACVGVAGNSHEISRIFTRNLAPALLTRLPGNLFTRCVEKGPSRRDPGAFPHARTKRRGGSRETMGAGISVVTLERREDGEVRARPLPAPAPSLPLSRTK